MIERGIWLGSGDLSKSLTESSVGGASIGFSNRLPVDFSVSLPYFHSFSFPTTYCGVYEEFLLSYFVDKSISLVESSIY